MCVWVCLSNVCALICVRVSCASVFVCAAVCGGVRWRHLTNRPPTRKVYKLVTTGDLVQGMTFVPLPYAAGFLMLQYDSKPLDTAAAGVVVNHTPKHAPTSDWSIVRD